MKAVKTTTIEETLNADPATTIEETLNADPATTIKETINALRAAQVHLKDFIKERAAARLASCTAASVCADLQRLERRLSAYVKM